MPPSPGITVIIKAKLLAGAHARKEVPSQKERVPAWVCEDAGNGAQRGTRRGAGLQPGPAGSPLHSLTGGQNIETLCANR